MPYPFTGYTADPNMYYNSTRPTMVYPYSSALYPTYTQNSTSTPNTFVWVQGEQAAKSYPVAPGNQVLLFDSDDSVFYIKKADQTGRPLPLEVYEFRKKEDNEVMPTTTVVYPEYATKDDVRNIIREELASFKSYNGKHYSPKNKEVE